MKTLLIFFAVLFCGSLAHAQSTEWEEYNFLVESTHPYPVSGFFVPVKIEGARKLKIYFSRMQTESGYDYLVVTDARGTVIERLSGTHNQYTTREIEGDYAGIQIATDSSENDWGFKIEKIFAQF